MGWDPVEVDGIMRLVSAYFFQQINNFLHIELTRGLAVVLHYLQCALIIGIDFNIAAVVCVIIMCYVEYKNKACDLSQ